MRFCTPDHFSLRVYLDETGVPRFRMNSLVPLSARGKTIPGYVPTNPSTTDNSTFSEAPTLNPTTNPDHNHDHDKTVLFIGNYAAILGTYAPFLLHTQSAPPTAHPCDIPIEWPPHLIPEYQRIIATCNVSTGRHDELKVMRNDAMLHRYAALTTALALPTPAALERLAAEFLLSEDTVRKVLVANKVLAPRVKETGPVCAESTLRRRDPRYKTVRDACLRYRTNAPGRGVKCSFGIAEVFPGGAFPLVCPVLGVPLDYDNQRSLRAVRVGRLDPSRPASEGNVILMSLLAQRAVEGTGNYLKILATMDTTEMREAWRRWCKTHGIRYDIT